MRKLLFCALGLTASAGLFQSCAPLYRPSTVHTPLFRGKHEVQAYLGTGSGGHEFQGAYSVTDNIAVMSNAVYTNRLGSSPVNPLESGLVGKRKDFLLEGGAGVYHNFGEGGVVEFFSGYGKGQTRGFMEQWQGVFSGANEYYISADYGRAFFQPAVGFASNVFDVSFAIRTSVVHYSGILIPEYQSTGEWLVKEKSNPGVDVYTEPALTIRTGYKWIKFMFQLGSALNIERSSIVEHRPYILSFGISASFSKKFLEDKEKEQKQVEEKKIE